MQDQTHQEPDCKVVLVGKVTLSDPGALSNSNLHQTHTRVLSLAHPRTILGQALITACALIWTTLGTCLARNLIKNSTLSLLLKKVNLVRVSWIKGKHQKCSPHLPKWSWLEFTECRLYQPPATSRRRCQLRLCINSSNRKIAPSSCPQLPNKPPPNIRILIWYNRHLWPNLCP